MRRLLWMIPFAWSLTAAACGDPTEPKMPVSNVPGQTDDDKDSDPNSDGKQPPENRAPVITGVTLSPSDPTVATVVTRAVQGASDPDGDAVQLKTVWKRNGVVVAGQTGDSLSGSFQKGDLIVAAVTPFDGKVDGTAVASPAATIGNSKPIVGNVLLSSATYAIGEAGPLTVSYQVHDADLADVHAVSIRWTKNGTPMGAYDDQLSVPFAALTDQDKWAVEVIAADDTEDSDPAGAAATVFIAVNHAPTIASVSLSPSGPKKGSTITASVTGVNDQDGHNVQLTYQWKVNGVTVAGPSGDSLASGFAKNDVVEVIVTPYDGFENGASVNSSVTVRNTKPVVSNVSLSDANYAIGESQPLTVSYQVRDDDLTDMHAVSIRWTKNGAPMGAYDDQLSVPFAALTDQDKWAVEVIAADDTEDSDPAGAAATVFIAVNHAPTIASVSLSPSGPKKGSTITASVTGVNDQDGHNVQLTYQWKVNGVTVAGPSGDSLASGFAKNDVVKVIVTPYDGFAYGATVSTSVTVLNSKPAVSSVKLSSTTYVGGGAHAPLTVSFSTSDADGDRLTAYIRWYKDGAAMTQYDDQTSVPFADLANGEIWAAGVAVHDGTELSEVATSAPALVTVTVFDPETTPASTLWDLALIKDSSTLDAEVRGQSACPTNANYECLDVRFTSPSPSTAPTPLTTAAWVVRPFDTGGKPLAVLIFLHGSGGQRERDLMVTMLSSLAALQNLGTTHQLMMISISGPGEEGSNGPDIETGRYVIFPDPRQNWDMLYAYVAMRTITYANTLPNVDSAKIGMTGISAGGLASFIANGVDDRLAAAIPVSASGYFLESARQGSWLSELNDLPDDYLLAVDRWFDPKAYLATQHAPVKMINGAQDEFFPLTSTRLTYEGLPGAVAKNICVTPNMDHYVHLTGNTASMATSQAAWVAKYLLGASFVQPGGPMSVQSFDASGVNVNITVTVPNMAVVPPLSTQRTVKLYASADQGWTYSEFTMTNPSGNTFTWSGAKTGVWANPAAVAWFAVVEDKAGNPGIGIPYFTVDWRSTLPQYPVGFSQYIAPL